MKAERSSPRRLLVVAYFFPPIANSGTQRPLKFVKYLPQHGWEPTVLTVDRPPDPEIEPALMQEIPAGLSVARVPMLSDRVGDVFAALAMGLVSRRKIADGISWRMRRAWQVPDLYALWRPTAVRAGVGLARNAAFDAIYATGFPWTGLLVGSDIARRTGLPLVADFRDLWSADDVLAMPMSRRRRARELALERRVIEQAAVVLSVSDLMTEKMRSIHRGVPASKFVTVTNGYDPDDLANYEEVSPPDTGRFRVVFTGAWKKVYGPEALYSAIERLHRISPDRIANLEVVAAGFPVGEADRRGLTQYIRELGSIPHPRALGLMRTGDALFLPIAPGVYQTLALPGKLFEYMASGRPIIMMGEPESEAGRLIRSIGGGLVIPADDGEQLAQLLVRGCERGRIDAPPQNRTLLTSYERPALARRLATILDATLSRLPSGACYERSEATSPV